MSMVLYFLVETGLAYLSILLEFRSHHERRFSVPSEAKCEIDRLRGELAAARQAISLLYRFFVRSDVTAIGLPGEVDFEHVVRRLSDSRVLIIPSPEEHVLRDDWNAGVDRFFENFSEDFLGKSSD